MSEHVARDRSAEETFNFDGHQLINVSGHTSLRRIVLPILGIQADGTVRGLGTAFCVSVNPPVLITA